MSAALRSSLVPVRDRLTDILVEKPELAVELESEEACHEQLRILKRYKEGLVLRAARFQELHRQLTSTTSEVPDEQVVIVALAEADSAVLVRFDDVVAEVDTAIADVVERLNSFQRDTNWSTASEQRRVSGVKLPKIELLKFNGDILRWQEFWEAFVSAVDTNPNLHAVEKMTYLRSQLVGDARNAISGLAVTNGNYEVAIQMLRERFGRPQAVIDAHYRSIADLQPASNHTSRIRAVFDTIERHLNSLESLGEVVEHKHFVSLIRSKLPSEVLFQLEHVQAGDAWNVHTLRWRIRQYLEARETAEGSGLKSRTDAVPRVAHSNSSSGVSHSNSSYPRGNSTNFHGTASALMANSKDKFVPICVFCGKDHWADECRAYSTVEARKQKLRGHCFGCLKPKHSIRSCRNLKPCFYCKVGQHHRSLCPKRFSSSSGHETVAVASADVPSAQPAAENSMLASGESVLMQTAKVVVQSADKSKSATTRLLFDTGSHRSYVSSRLVKELQLKPRRKERLTVFTFASMPPKEVDTAVVDLQVRLLDGSIFKFSANVIDTITGGIQRSAVDISKIGPLYRALPLADSIPTVNERSSIDLMIGNDHYWDLVTSEKVEVSEGLYLIGSKVGWILTGRHTGSRPASSTVSSLLVADWKVNLIEEAQLSFASVDPVISNNFDVQKFWDLETVGIKDRNDDISDEAALTHFNETVEFRAGRYFVTWPWREKNVELPENYQLSLGRLNTLIKRYRDQPHIFQQYQAVINQQLELGIIEKVEGGKAMDNRIHYIPHHAVLSPERSTKLRVVYDASAKAKKESNSLNDCLYRGPVLLEDLCALLIRFRLNRVAVIADIEKAFLQVGLQEKDRDVARFLWLRDPNTPSTENNVQVYRFARVPFGVISSPFLLAATITYHLQKDGSEIAQQILRDIYVDNVISGVDSAESAIGFYTQTKALFASASMNIRGWASSSTEFLSHVPAQDRVSGTVVKVLGYPWDTQTDTLVVGTVQLPSSDRPTKRLVLKFIASVFDPLGLFSPAVLLAKLFLQQLWINKVDWDDPLPEKDCATWNSVLASITPVFSQAVPRFVGFGDSTDEIGYELHCFCDASNKAYGACVYLRVQSKLDTECHLLFSKARVAPVEGMSLPRLELLAVYLGSKILDFVARSIQVSIGQKFIWSDSQCVLHWLNSVKPLSVFVRNRVAAIKAYAGVQYRYVPSEENPADLVSRGKSACDLSCDQLWWHGPKWLPSSDSAWPSVDFLNASKNSVQDITPNEDASPAFLAPEGANAEGKGTTPFDCKQFSSLTKLLRITAYCMRFMKRLRKETLPSGCVTAAEMREAKVAWVRVVQRECFAEVLTCIERKQRHPLVDALGLWIDERGILRCGGRLAKSDLPDLAVFPMLLPKKHHFTQLVIGDAHFKLAHAGVSHTLARVRSEFWIPSGRSEVRRVVLACSRCRRFDGGPYRLPDMPAFPRARVTASPPFTYTGLDYLGPLFVKEGNGQPTKVWICLFTCLSTRAIHLEVVGDMSAEQFLLCLQRFIARRGKPSVITSDNAPQFKLTHSALEELWRRVVHDRTVLTYTSDHGIGWTFITERAPWMGGYYERLVRLVKQGIRKTLGKACVSFIQLQTLVIEIEAVLNSRPLSYVGSDFDGSQVITPAHFLSLNPKAGLPSVDQSGNEEDPTYVEKLSSRDKLLETWKKGQRFLDRFWKNWSNEYLLSLRERSQKAIKQPHSRSSESPKVGAVVLLFNEGPRGTWRLARIEELIRSSDGEVRSARVRLPSGLIVNRSLMHLYPLETEDSPAEPEAAPKTEAPCTNSEEKCDHAASRPKRLAAKIASTKIKQIQAYEDELSE